MRIEAAAVGAGREPHGAAALRVALGGFRGLRTYAERGGARQGRACRQELAA